MTVPTGFMRPCENCFGEGYVDNGRYRVICDVCDGDGIYRADEAAHQPGAAGDDDYPYDPDVEAKISEALNDTSYFDLTVAEAENAAYINREIAVLQAELDAALERERELRAALEPLIHFAEASLVGQEERANDRVYAKVNGIVLTIGDLRRAASTAKE